MANGRIPYSWSGVAIIPYFHDSLSGNIESYIYYFFDILEVKSPK